MKDKIVHPAFAVRMEQACNGNALVPPINYGRLGWFVEQLDTRFGIEVVPETVRKWFSGESLPRHQSMTALAQIMKVDESWLALGVEPALTAKEARARNATADGAVNVTAGFISMCGGTIAFPLESDTRAKESKIDIYATIKGARYDIHVATGDDIGGYWEFAIPVEAAPTLVIGVVRTEKLACQFYEMEFDKIAEKGHRKGPLYEVVMRKKDGANPWRRITTFEDRL